MSDTVMVPREPNPVLLPVIASMVRRLAIPTNIDPDEVYFNNGHARQIYEAIVAASPPVGGDSFLGHLVVPKSGVGAVFIDKGQPIPLMGDKGRVVPIYEGPQSVVAPPPPSVSTGSRPQEAVPTEQADGAVVEPTDRFAECYENGAHPNCHRCYRGEVPDMADDSGFWVEMGSFAGGASEHGLHGWIELIEHHPDGTTKRREYIATDSPVYATPQPADGCSSNEGAALWAMHLRGPDDIYPAPDHATALNWSDYVNDFVAQVGSDVEVVAAPVHWSGTAEAHAEGLPLAVAGWTLPDGRPALTILPQTEKGS